MKLKRQLTWRMQDAASIVMAGATSQARAKLMTMVKRAQMKDQKNKNLDSKVSG
jgi:hypothetical protein